MAYTRKQRREYQRAYRKKKGGQTSYHKKWASKNPEKVKAQNKLNAEVRSGKRKRPKAPAGTKGTMQAHHTSYSGNKVTWKTPIAHAKTKPNTRKRAR